MKHLWILEIIILTDTNYKDQLQRYFQNVFNMVPQYEIVTDNTNIFKCNLYKDNKLISTGTGNTKKKAEQDSSRNALIKYGVLN